MQITIFSFFMACLWSNLIIAFMYFFRKNQIVIQFFSITSILLIYILSLLRITIPIELPVNHIIISKYYSQIGHILNIKMFNNKDFTITIGNIVFDIWVIGAIILLVKYARRCYNSYNYLEKGRIEDNGTLKTIFKQIKRTNDKNTYDIFRHDHIYSPACYGIFKKRIVFPTKEYTEKELLYMMRHEYTHFKNKDMLFKILVNIMYCIYWWNPVLYLLYQDLLHISEVKCDLNVISTMQPKEIKEYLEILRKVLNGTDETLKNATTSNNTLYLLRESYDNIAERFEIIANKKYRKAKTNGFIFFMLIVSFLLSYAFIIQSHFEAPIQEYEAYETVYQVETNKSYIIEYKDGTYKFISHNQEFNIDKNKAIEMQKQGYKLIKEN